MFQRGVPPKGPARKTYPNKWNPHRNWIWRLRGKARDGLTVTLGRYETTPEAEADLARMTVAGGYRNLMLEALEPVPQPEPD